MKVVAAAVFSSQTQPLTRGSDVRTLNSSRMLCQTSERCSCFVLHCMRRRVQELEDAANPSWLYETF